MKVGVLTNDKIILSSKPILGDVDGVIKDVSATVFATEDNSEILGIVGKDLSFKELSLVMDGACGGAYIEPVN